MRTLAEREQNKLSLKKIIPYVILKNLQHVLMWLMCNYIRKLLPMQHTRLKAIYAKTLSNLWPHGSQYIILSMLYGSQLSKFLPFIF